MARRRARPPAEPTAAEQRRWDRAADLMSRGAICVTTRGRVPTDADLDAVEQFAAFLHRQPLRQTAPVPPCYRSPLGILVHEPGCACPPSPP